MLNINPLPMWYGMTDRQTPVWASSWENLFIPYANNRRRSAYAFAQSIQRLCCSLPRQYNTSCFYIRNFKPLPNFCGCAGRLESTLVENPEDRFSCDEARIVPVFQSIEKMMAYDESNTNILLFNSLQTRDTCYEFTLMAYLYTSPGMKS